MQVFDRNSMPDLTDPAWGSYSKKLPIRAMRITGPFKVKIDGQGDGGVVACDDGYLCIDARGYPYPVAADEFDLIYGPEQDPIAGLMEQLSTAELVRLQEFLMERADLWVGQEGSPVDIAIKIMEKM